MTRLYRDNAAALVGAEHYREIGHRTGSTDMGDLSMVMPILHPYMGGATGSGHGADYQIVDQKLAYLGTAKALASMVVDLLADGATGAREVLKSAPAPDDARAVPVVPAGHRPARGVRGVAARARLPLVRPSASGARDLRHRELADFLSHRGPDLRRVPVVHAVVDARDGDLGHEVADAVPRAHGSARGRARSSSAWAWGRRRSRRRARRRVTRTRCSGRTDTRGASACR